MFLRNLLWKTRERHSANSILENFLVLFRSRKFTRRYAHFWGPRAPKRGKFLRRRHAFYETSVLFLKIARKLLKVSTKIFRTFQLTLGSTSDRCFTHIKSGQFLLTITIAPIPISFFLFWLSTRYFGIFAECGGILPLFRYGWGTPKIGTARKTAQTLPNAVREGHFPDLMKCTLGIRTGGWIRNGHIKSLMEGIPHDFGIDGGITRIFSIFLMFWGPLRTRYNRVLKPLSTSYNGILNFFANLTKF